MITDDELLLYHYRDGLDAAERARIGQALSEQPALAQRLQALVSRLDAAAALPEVPVPELTLRRWQVALERAANKADAVNATRTAPAGRRWGSRWPAMAAAAAAAVVALFLVISQRTIDVPTPVNAPPVADTGDASAYERGLKVHLASTERQLAGLDSATPEERARLIETIIKDPGKYFASPREVVSDPKLGIEEKRRILDSWAVDAQLLSVAEEENMGGADRPGLREVKLALLELEKGA